MLRSSKKSYRLTVQEKVQFHHQGYSTANVHEVEAHEFIEYLDGAKSTHRFGPSLDRRSLEEYNHCRLFLTVDGSAGAALDGDGIISVFKNPNLGGRGASATVLLTAIKEGGRILDCYDTFLPRYYSHFGFREVARLKWNDSNAPLDWSKETFFDFNKGEPDVVFMALRDNDPQSIGKRIGSFYNTPKTKHYVESWKDGVAMQREWVK